MVTTDPIDPSTFARLSLLSIKMYFVIRLQWKLPSLCSVAIEASKSLFNKINRFSVWQTLNSVLPSILLDCNIQRQINEHLMVVFEKYLASSRLCVWQERTSPICIKDRQKLATTKKIETTLIFLKLSW